MDSGLLHYTLAERCPYTTGNSSSRRSDVGEEGMS